MCCVRRQHEFIYLYDSRNDEKSYFLLEVSAVTADATAAFFICLSIIIIIIIIIANDICCC